MKARQLSLFEGVERVRMVMNVASLDARARWKVYDGTVTRDVALPRAGHHGRLALVRFDDDGTRNRVGSYAGCLLIVDLAGVEHVEGFVPRAVFEREERARVAGSRAAVRAACDALILRYAPKAAAQ